MNDVYMIESLLLFWSWGHDLSHICPRGVMGITISYILYLYNPVDEPSSGTTQWTQYWEESICYLFNKAILRSRVYCTYVVCCNGQYIGPQRCRVVLSVY